MRRTTRFVQSQGTVTCNLEGGGEVQLPVVPGLLKHPTVDQLRALLVRPKVAEKYTVAALRRAPWLVLRQFPRPWLLQCIPRAGLAQARLRAIEFLLGSPR